MEGRGERTQPLELCVWQRGDSFSGQKTHTEHAWPLSLRGEWRPSMMAGYISPERPRAKGSRKKAGHWANKRPCVQMDRRSGACLGLKVPVACLVLVFAKHRARLREFQANQR